MFKGTSLDNWRGCQKGEPLSSALKIAWIQGVDKFQSTWPVIHGGKFLVEKVAQFCFFWKRLWKGWNIIWRYACSREKKGTHWVPEHDISQYHASIRSLCAGLHMSNVLSSLLVGLASLTRAKGLNWIGAILTSEIRRDLQTLTVCILALSRNWRIFWRKRLEVMPRSNVCKVFENRLEVVDICSFHRRAGNTAQN